MRTCPWRVLALGAGIAFLCSGVTGCSGTSPNVGSENERPQALATLRAQHKDVIAQFPSHPDSEKVFQILVEAVRADKALAGEDAAEALIYMFPDDNLGLYAFDRCYASRATTAFCAEVEAKAPGTAVGLAALNARLSELAKEQPEQFLKACDEVVASGAGDPRRRVALLQRAQFQRGEGRFKEAGLDYLRFWEAYPEKARELELLDATVAVLRRGGLVFEGALIETTSDPGAAARGLMAELDGMTASASSASVVGPEGPLAIYYRLTPKAEDIARAVEAPGTFGAMPAATRAAYHVRLAALHADALDTGQTVATLSLFVDAAESALREAAPAEESWARLRRCCAWAEVALGRMFGAASYSRNSKSYARDGEGLVLRVLNLDLGLAESISVLRGDKGAQEYLRAVEAYRERALQWGNREGPRAAYRHFLERYPDSAEAPVALLALADYTKRALDAPLEAMGVYAEVADSYPSSPEASVARARRALILYEDGRAEEAHEECEALLASAPEAPAAELARFLSALSEAEMGMEDMAEEHLQELVKQYPQSNMAPRALFWIASRRLSEQSYDEALRLFRDLCERYPNSEAGARAREYVDRLGKQTQGGGS